jgi:site-specific recombinase XerD
VGHPPVLSRAYKQYRLSKPKTNGFAFINKDKTPVTRQQIADTLQKLMKTISHTPKHFNTHSFRIGKATDMANKGYSYAQISMLGRWRSNAFLKYIKPTIIHGTN